MFVRVIVWFLSLWLFAAVVVGVVVVVGVGVVFLLLLFLYCVCVCARACVYGCCSLVAVCLFVSVRVLGARLFV